MLFWDISIPAQFNGWFILPILAGVSQMISSKLLTPAMPPPRRQRRAAADQQDDAMVHATVLRLDLRHLYFRVLLYWLFSNVFQVLQQLAINWYFDKKKVKSNPEEEVIKP
jgi:membrane protein insertase Oxa1/YidC/SpoIIIJ